GAGEVHLVGKFLAFVGAVGVEDVLHLVDQDAFAGRPAGMDAVIAVGVVVAILEEHADLVPAGDHDAAVAILHVAGLGDEGFGHGRAPKALGRILTGTGRSGNAWRAGKWQGPAPARAKRAREQMREKSA